MVIKNSNNTTVNQFVIMLSEWGLLIFFTSVYSLFHCVNSLFWDETVKSSLIWHGKHDKVLHSWRLSFCSLAYHLTQKAANLLFICTHYLRYAGSLMICDGISIPNELSVFYPCALAREEKTCIYKWKPIIFWCTCTIFSLCLNPFGNNNSLFL